MPASPLRPNQLRTACGVVVVAVVCVVAPGCGGSGQTKVGVEAATHGGAKKILIATSSTLKFSADQTVPGTSLAHAAALLDQAVQEGVKVRATLDAMANSPDPWGVYFTKALCTGMQQLADQPEDTGPVPQASWSDFLVKQLALLLNNPLGLIQQKVDGFLTTLDLAQVNPRLAQVWYQECVARPR